MRNLFKKTMLFTMAGVILLGSIAPVFGNVNENQTLETNNNAQTEVIYNQESSFGVTIPKKADLGSDKSTDYLVEVFGDIASNETILVVPEKSFFMKDKSNTTNPKADVEATVTQNKTGWKFNELDVKGEGNILAEDLTAGVWEGSFFFNIKLENSNISVTAKNEAGEDINASATNITGEQKDKLLDSLVEEGFIEETSEVDALINVESDNFDGLAETTFDVSTIAKEGDEVVILHFDETKQEWEYIGKETVDENGLISGNFTSYSPVAFVKVTENGTYEPISKLVSTFADNSWADIAKACQTNTVPETWKVGDIKTMLIDGVEYEVVIIGKNHDIYADGSGTAPLTFQLKDTLNTKYTMNDTDHCVGGWNDSVFYTILNTTIFETLENNVKNNIKSVSKITNISGSNTTNLVTETSSDKLFLLSYKEVFDFTSNYVYKLEGIQYEYYKIETNRIKYNSNTASIWWLRSPFYALAGNGFFVTNTNGTNNGKAASNTYSISFAFCF